MQAPKPEFITAEHFTNFWKKGNGKELVDWTNARLSLDRFNQFSALYHQADDKADAVVKDLFFTKPFHKALQEIQEYINHPVDYTSTTILPSVRGLFLQTQETPDWVNWEQIEKGAAFCRKASLNALISLRDYSLMGGYDYAYLNKPLIFTGALKKGAVKRLSDTLDFWVNVTRQSALRTHQKGYDRCIKTRLIHSYSRLMILEKHKDWNTEKWGLPINTWDMSATYIGFSLVFLHGLKKLGIRISQEEEDAHFHLWKYIGYLIGIPAEFMPNSKKEATENFYLWTSIQPPSDEASILLAKSLLDENLESTVFKYQFQRRNLRYLHVCMNWFLLDKEVNTRLKIPKAPLTKIFPNFVKTSNYLFQTFNSMEQQIQKGGKAQEKILEDYSRTNPKNSTF